MNYLRKRLKHYSLNNPQDYEVVMAFIKPVLDKGEREEKRLTQSFFRKY